MKKTRIAIATGAFLITLTSALAVPRLRHTKPDDNVIHLNGRIESITVDLGPKVAGRVVSVLARIVRVSY